MSGTGRNNAAAVTQVDKDGIQADLLEAIRKRAAADRLDMIEFFGYTEDSDFTPEKCNGIEHLAVPANRLAMARLYILAKSGLTVEQVTTTQDMRTEIDKRHLARQFRDTIFNGDDKAREEMWVSMTETAKSLALPKTNFFDDRSLVNNYHSLTFVPDVCSRFAGIKPRELPGIAAGTNASLSNAGILNSDMNKLLPAAWMRITEKSYSNANAEARGALEGVLPNDDLLQDDKDELMLKGNQYLVRIGNMLGDLSGKTFLEAGDAARPLYRTLPMLQDIDAGKKSAADYKDSFDLLMDFEELSSEDLKNPYSFEEISFDGGEQPAPAPEITSVKEELSLEAFHREVHSVTAKAHEVKPPEVKKFENQQLGFKSGPSQKGLGGHVH